MTKNGSLDANVKDFLSSCINSVEQLEILLLLRQRQELDADTINRELRTSLLSVTKRLEDLAKKSLITIRHDEGCIVRYVYAPPERVLLTIDQLASLYLTHRVAIINTIFSKPSEMLKDFSDAFRLRDKDRK